MMIFSVQAAAATAATDALIGAIGVFKAVDTALQVALEAVNSAPASARAAFGDVLAAMRSSESVAAAALDEALEAWRASDEARIWAFRRDGVLLEEYIRCAPRDLAERASARWGWYGMGCPQTAVAFLPTGRPWSTADDLDEVEVEIGPIGPEAHPGSNRAGK